MTIAELYEYLDGRIPKSLSCDWDNDGLMCSSDPDREISKVLIALDVTEKVVRTAIDGGYDLIISHHPLIFHPLKTVTPHDIVQDKIISLIKADVSVMSFHTRLDAVQGGVNDVLAEMFGLHNVEIFGKEKIGRVGMLEKSVKFKDFAEHVGDLLGCDGMSVAYGGRYVSRLAILGGAGSDDVEAAKEAGADTFLTGELSYHHLCDASENGVNLIAAGHFYTENPVCYRLADLVNEADEYIEVDVVDSITFENV